MTSNKIVISIEPLTPLWTGNAKQRCDRVHESGIIGSLRYWYESIVRGLGYYACDPTFRKKPNEPCLYDGKKGLGNICRVCQVFGCSGYARDFTLHVEGDKPGPDGQSKRSKMVFLPTRPAGFNPMTAPALLTTLRFIEHYAALGARTSQGNGAISITDCNDPAWLDPGDSLVQYLKSAKASNGKNRSGVPDLSDFRGATVQVSALNDAADKKGWPSRADDAKDVRKRFREKIRENGASNANQDCDRLMGKRGQGGKIFVTSLYDNGGVWGMRVFSLVESDEDRETMKTLLDETWLTDEVEKSLKKYLPVKVDSVVRYPTGVTDLIGAREERTA